MNYDDFYNYNEQNLLKNYKKRRKIIRRSSFYEYCKFVYVALEKNFWLHESYKSGIVFKKENK
mgnify:CR=1 FL=1